MPKTPKSVVVIYVSRDGVEEVQVHSQSRHAEREGDTLYAQLRPLVVRLDRKAREAKSGGF